MTHVIGHAALAALMLAGLPRPAAAQVIETRHGDSNPMVSDVSTRPEPHALLEHGARRWAVAPPDLAPDGRGARVRLLAMRF